MTRRQVTIRIVLIIGIVVAANLLGNRAYFRLDFTADDRYTLSQITKELMSDLEEPVTVRAYFSEDMLPEHQLIRNDLEDLLKEYQNLSGGNMVYEFINPNVSDSLEKILVYEKGLQFTIEQVRERDKFVERRVYLGAEIQIADRKGTIPNFTQETSMEYALTKEIRRQLHPEKPRVAFIRGHGEPEMEMSFEVKEALGFLYKVEELTMTDTARIGIEYRAIAIINPKDSIPPAHFQAFDEYLKAGGNIFLCLFTVYQENEQEFSKGLNARPSTGMREWLGQKGIIVGTDYLYDQACGQVTVPAGNSVFGQMYTQVAFPYSLLLSKFPKHVITTGLEQMYVPIASSVSVAEGRNYEVDTLLFTSANSGIMMTPAGLNFDGQVFRVGTYDRSSIPFAMGLTGDLGGGGNSSRMVVVSNGRFAVNPPSQFGGGRLDPIRPADNVNFAVNSIDWLADETGLIDLRTRMITSRPIKEIEDGDRNFYKYLNVGLPVLMILLVGFLRFQFNRRKRTKWQQS